MTNVTENLKEREGTAARGIPAAYPRHSRRPPGSSQGQGRERKKERRTEPWEESPPAVLGPDVNTRTSPNECHRELGIDVSIPCDIVHILEDTLSKVTNVTGNWASTFPFPVKLCTF